MRICRALRLAAAMGILAPWTFACTSSETGNLLDAHATLQAFPWWDNQDWPWYQEHIPLFDSPDQELNATYYYRWELLTKHLIYGSPETGYTFTEFIDRPFWSGTYGAISCPLGHQAYEIRWLKDRRIIQDFAHYWFETPGAEPRSYSNWYGDAMWATFAVLGDPYFLEQVYPHMEAQVAGWTEERWDPEHRMYRWVGAWDGMETNINSRLTDDTFAGAEGYRPTLNSYLFADLSALAHAAAFLGDEEKAVQYQARAQALKERVQEELWDPEREFFFHQFAFDEKGGIRAKTLTYESGPYAGNPHGRELLGYVPWQFGLPDPGYEGAWKFLMDPDYFWAPYGPTGVEQGDPQFLVSPRCCVWSGNAWPYATTQTLVAMANLLNDYQQDVVDREDYVRLLRTYALSQRMDGRPYIAEAADPFTGSWSGHNTFYHSEHYLHSGFVDLVITGLVGIRPSAQDSLTVNPLVPDEWPYFALEGVDYHGHDLAVVWDRDGSRYGRGSGLAVYLDGREAARSTALSRLTLSIPPPGIPALRPRLHNYAVNNGPGFFPHASASSSLPTAPPFYAVDGNRWYHPSPPNRWVTAEDAPGTQWFQVDFGVSRLVSQIQLYFLDSQNGPVLETTGEEGTSGFPLSRLEPELPVLPPRRFEIQAWDADDARWTVIPGQSRIPGVPVGRRANTVNFPELSTSRVRVELHRQPDAQVGLTEVEVWGPGSLPLANPDTLPGNLAWNPGSRDYPRVRASFSDPSSPPEQAVDGRIALTRYSRNRWSAQGSPNAEDWLEVDFGQWEVVGRVEVFLLGDGRTLSPPASMRLEGWTRDGWTEIRSVRTVPTSPTAWARNRLTFDPLELEKIRIHFRHASPGVTGVTELRVWSS